MESWVAQYGYAGLLVFSFLAATLIPVSSEGALALALNFKLGMIGAVTVATIGNCAGVAVNYWLGHVAAERLLARRPGSAAQRRAVDLLRRYGLWGLLLSWLPVIGDPITVVAGALRLNLRAFLLVAFSLRFLRYVAIAWVLSS
jgi:membrane protein YqaA with SNARE-associated domain